MDAEVNVGMEMGAYGESTGIGLIVAYSVDSVREPFAGRIESSVEISAGGTKMTQILFAYAEQTEDGLILYVSSNGGTLWDQTKMEEQEEALLLGSAASLDLLLSCGDCFTETGRDTVDGRERISYSGVLPGTIIGQMLADSGMTESLLSLLGDVELSPELFDNVDDIQMTVSFDGESGYLLSYEVDMTAAMHTMMTRVLGELMGDYGYDAELASFRLSSGKISVTLSGFDTTSVEIPPEVRSKAAASAQAYTDPPPEEGPPLGRTSYRDGAPRYENPGLGFGCQLKMNWAISTREGKAQLAGIMAERYGEAADGYLDTIDFHATRAADPAVICVRIVELPQDLDFDPEEAASLSAEELKDQMRAAGLKVLEAEENRVPFAGRETPGLRYHILDHGESAYYQTVLFTAGKYLAIVEMGAGSPESLEELPEMFFPLP